VYAAANEPTGNRIQVFARSADGTLTPGAAVPTGGAGSGGFEGSANGLILASRGGESSPNNLTGGPDRLLATNTGSSSVSVFRTTGHELELPSVQSAGLDHRRSPSIPRVTRSS
jgi:hypothetical protein